MSGNPDNLLSPGDFVAPDPSNPSYASVLGSQVATRAAANLLWRGAKGVAGDAWDLIQKPGQILRSEATPYPGAVNSVDPAGYAARLAGYGMGVGSVLAPATSAGMFAGRGANIASETARKRMGTLAEAEAMERGGWPRNAPSGREDIFNTTGWFRGADGEWRFIIPDSSLRLKTENLQADRSFYVDPANNTYRLPSKPTKLSDIMEHDELFQAYPKLADIMVSDLPQRFINMNYRGMITPGKIQLAPDNAFNLTRVLAHEGQHAVQRAEGFARAGNPQEFLPAGHMQEMEANANLIGDLERQLQRDHNIDPDIVNQHFGFPPYNKARLNYEPELMGAPFDIVQDLVNAKIHHLDLHEMYDDAMRNYLSLGGEVEARTTERALVDRNWWRLPERTGTLSPDLTKLVREPYPGYDQQIIRFDQNSPLIMPSKPTVDPNMPP